MKNKELAPPLIHQRIMNSAQLDEALDDIFETQLDSKCIEKSRTILIKVCLPSAVKSFSSGALTRPDLLRGVLLRISERNPTAKIIVVEGETYSPMDEVFRALQLEEIARGIKNVEFMDLDADQVVKVTSPLFNKLGIVCLPAVLVDYDLMINLAVPRRHIHERYVGALHNLLPLIQGVGFRSRLQPYIGNAIADLAMLHPGDLTILDARTFQEELGPVQGLPKRYDTIISAPSAYAVDAAALKLIEESPKRVPHMRYFARKHGLKKVVLPEMSGTSQAKFIPPLQYRIWRMSLQASRTADFITRISTMLQLSSFALLATGFTDIVTGRWIAIPNIVKTVRDLAFKLNVLPELTNKRITINKHIKDQTVS